MSASGTHIRNNEMDMEENILAASEQIPAEAEPEMMETTQPEDIGLEAEMPAAEQDISATETAEEEEPQPGTARKTIVGVRFRTAGKIYYFSPDENIVKKGDHVIVETARGVEFGTVISNPMELGTDKIPKQLKSILRVATQEDIDREKERLESRPLSKIMASRKD